MIGSHQTALDIGANLGLMSYHLAKNTKETIAFEPMSYNYQVIEKVKHRYQLSNLTILTHALGNENKQIQLVLPIVDGVKKQGWSHVINDKMTEVTEGNPYATECYKLDEVAALKGKKIDAIKIHVENFEYEVFLGAEKLLKADKPIIYCELSDNQNSHDCFRYLEGLGYTTMVLQNGKLEPVKSNPSHIQNFFFLPS
jgi:FkbM family methyltransferase